MEINLLNPHIRYARFHTAVASGKEYSINYDCRLFFFTKADGYLHIGDEKYKISNNSAVYLPPTSKYKLVFPQDKKYEAIVFNFDLFQTHSHLKESLTTASESSFSPEIAPQYELPPEFSSPIITSTDTDCELLWQCADEFVTKRKLYREKSSALLKTFLISLLRESAVHGGSRLVSEIIEFIKANYNSPTLTNEEIAGKFGYHPYYLSKLMKSATGKSLKQFLIHYRVQCAKTLLINTDLSVDTIAWKAGFGTSAYFIKCFKDAIGTTPLAYRKRKQPYSL